MRDRERDLEPAHRERREQMLGDRARRRRARVAALGPRDGIRVAVACAPQRLRRVHTGDEPHVLARRRVGARDQIHFVLGRRELGRKTREHLTILRLFDCEDVRKRCHALDECRNRRDMRVSLSRSLPWTRVRGWGREQPLDIVRCNNQP
eukprot:Amastigsp_a676607_80.p3 type:complete len:150 gc:universal Amastigsp_a676607_80:528-977(+)